MNPGLVIRELELNDYQKGYIELLGNLTQSGYLPKPIFKRVFQAVGGNPFHFIFVMEDKEKETIVASTTLLLEWKFTHGACQAGHIEDVVVNPIYQGQGLGRKMIDYILTFVRETKPECYKVILDCAEKNVGFYEKCGLKKNGVEMRYDF